MSPDSTPGLPDPLEPLPPREDLTVDLDAGEVDAIDDLQAFADAVAEETPEAPSPSEAEGDPMDRVLEELERELEEPNQRIIELERHESDHQDRHHRLMADFNNYRNRTAREIQMGVEQAEKRLLLEILPVLDSFDRCVGASYATIEDFRSGVGLIQKQFQDALRRLDVAPVPLEPGDPFDAAHAEALTTTADRYLPDGAVATVFERGYTLRNQLLRPARVVVNHHPEGEHAPEPSE